MKKTSCFSIFFCAIVWAFTALFLSSGLIVFAAPETSKPATRTFWQLQPNLNSVILHADEAGIPCTGCGNNLPHFRSEHPAGSKFNPYQITTPIELASLAWRVNVRGETLEGLFFEINPISVEANNTINPTDHYWINLGVSVTGILNPTTGLPEPKTKPFLGNLTIAEGKQIIGIWRDGSDAAETITSNAQIENLTDRIEIVSVIYGRQQGDASILTFGTDFDIRGTGANSVIILNTSKALTYLANQINHYDGTSYYGGAFNIGGPSRVFEEGLHAFNITNANYELGTSFKGDFGDMYFTPIGTAANPFRGTFDGRAQLLPNLVIYSETTTGFQAKTNGEGFTSYAVWKYYPNMGLFGVTENASIQNLQLSNVRVIVSELSLKRKVFLNDSSLTVAEPSAITNPTSNLAAGGLVGYAKNTEFNNCVVEGEVVVYTNALATVGGFIGRNEGSRIQNCSADVKVKTEKTGMSGISNVGGFAGTTANGIIRNVYTQGMVSADNLTPGSTAQINLGGIVGFVSGGSGRIFSTLSLTDLLGEPSLQKRMGGIVGKVEPGLFPNTPAVSNFRAGYYKRLNDFSANITDAIGNSAEFVVPSGNLMRMLTTSDPYDTQAFFDNNDRWASGDAERASWDFNETWKFDNARRLPILQIFGQYTLYVFNGSEIYQTFFIDPNYDPQTDVENTGGRLYEREPNGTIKTENGERIPVLSMNVYSGDRVVIRAEFRNVPEESTSSSPVSYGKYYLFSRFIHGENNSIPGVQGTNSISYSFDCSAARSGLYSVSVQTKIIAIRVDIEDDSGAPARPLRNNGNYSSGIESQSYDYEYEFLISYGHINNFRAFSKNGSPYSFSEWEIRNSDWESLDNPATFSQNPLRVGVGAGATSGATADFARYLVEGDGENGRQTNRLYLFITANFTSKSQQTALKAEGNGGYYSLHFFDGTTVEPSNIIDRNNSLSFTQANAIPLRKTFLLQTTVQDGYLLKGWSIQIGNDKEELPLSEAWNIQFVDSITALFQVQGDILLIRSDAANITITALFEINADYIPFELFGINGWYIVAPAIGLICAAIPPITIVIVKKRRHKKKRLKQIEK